MPLIDPPRKAPDFTLPDQHGNPFHLRDHESGGVVLFFYPKDNTEACAREAADFSRLSDQFAAAGTLVAGTSIGGIADKQKFAAACGLGIPMLADARTDRHGEPRPEVCARYGVWGTKQLYGKVYTGLIRTTYLIGPGCRVIRRWDRVRTPGHAKAVLEAIKELGLPPVPRPVDGGHRPTG